MHRPSILLILSLALFGAWMALHSPVPPDVVRSILVYLLPAVAGLVFIVGVRERQFRSRESQLISQLQASETRFRQVLSANPIGLFLWNTGGSITFANEAFLRMLGYTKEDLNATPIRWEDIVPPEFQEADILTYEELVRTGHSSPSRKEFRRKDGTRIPVLTGAALLEGDHKQGVGFAIDISAQVAAEDARFEAEMRYRTLAEHSATGIWQLDAEMRTVYANPTLLQMLQLTDVGELIGNSAQAFFSEASWQKVQEQREKRKKGIASIYEVELVKKDGRLLPVLISGGPLFDSQGQFKGAIATSTDLTDLKQTQNALIQSEKRFRALVENAREAISIWDERGHVILTTSASERIHGYSFEELKGRSVADLIHEEDRPNIKAALEAVSKEAGKKAKTKARVLHKDGRWRLCEGVFTNLRHDPAIGGIVLNYRDITEHTAAQEALRRSEERYRNLVESAREAIFTVSPTGIITSRNPAAALLSDVPDEEALNCSFTPFIAPEDLGLANEMFCRAVRGEQCEPFEVRVLGKTRAIQMEFSLTPQLENGAVVSILGIGRDVSQRRALEDQLRQAQKMECIGQLAGGVAHDFNNLLTIVRGNGYLIAEDPSAPDITDMAREICEAADRGASLTRQLLTFSRNQPVEATDINLNDVIGELMKMLRRLIGEDITLHFSSGSHLPQICADVGMIEQVLVNLTVNARDAMPQGGDLIIQTDHCTFPADVAQRSSDARPGHFVHLSVIDTGSGIAPEHLPHIFEPFFTTKDVGKGTGLGLATVYGIIKQHHGWVEVYSEAGSGTRFDIYFPARKVAEAIVTNPPEGKLALPGGNETILLVEDEASLRTVTRAMLSRLGYRVLEASSGVEALKIWQAYRDEIDLLFTDIVMPDGVSGPQLAAELRKHERNLKVLFTSGYSAKYLTADARLAPGINYLHKPYSPEQLAGAIRLALQSTSST